VLLAAPEFTHLSDAEQFLAKVAALVAHGQLDFQAGQNLSALAKNWIDAQYAREELAIKQFNAGSTEHEQTIRNRPAAWMRSSLGSSLLVTIEESKSAGSRSPRFSRRLKISAVLLFRLPCRRPGEKVCPGWNVIPISH